MYTAVRIVRHEGYWQTISGYLLLDLAVVLVTFVVMRDEIKFKWQLLLILPIFPIYRVLVFTPAKGIALVSGINNLAVMLGQVTRSRMNQIKCILPKFT